MSWMCVGWYPVVADKIVVLVQCVRVVQFELCWSKSAVRGIP